MEHEIRKSLEGFTARLRSAVDTELDQLARELMQALESARQQARTEAEANTVARVAAARTEAEASANARAAAVRVEVEGRLAAQIEAARIAAHAAAMAEAKQESARLAANLARDTAAARASEREARLAAVERLLGSVRRIDAANTLRDTLEALAESAAAETPRVAVLLIEGNTVRAFSHRGFDAIPSSGPLAAGGVVEACVRHGQPAFTSDAAGLRAPGFAGLADDRAGFAAPLRVGDKTVAVLYADDAGEGERDAPAAWPEALELLSRHTSQHLENLTAVKALLPGDAANGAGTQPRTQSEMEAEAARKYARLLVSEIKLYNEPAVRLGRAQRDLRTRLGAEIDRAHRTYLDRVPASVVARDAYFETELVQTLAGGDPSTL